MLRLHAHSLDQLRTEDALRKTGEIFYHGGQGQLAAGLIAIDYQRLEIGSRGIDRGGQAGAPAPDNDHVVHRKSSSTESKYTRQSFVIAGARSKVL